MTSITFRETVKLFRNCYCSQCGQRMRWSA